MWWLLAAQGAKSFIGAMGARAAAFNQQALQSQQESDLYAANSVENQAIAEANLQNTIRTGFREGLLNVQRAQAKKQANAQNFGLRSAVQEVLSANSNNAAAAGAVGASVNAVAADVAAQQDKATAENAENYRVQIENFDVQLQDLIQAGQDALRSTRKVSTRPTQRISVPSYLEALIGGGLQAAATANSIYKGPNLGNASTSRGETSLPLYSIPDTATGGADLTNLDWLNNI